MATTISSSMSGPVVLGPSDDPFIITSTGTVTSTGPVDGIDGAAGTTWTIANAGIVAASGGDGISLGGPGIVSNTGSIWGLDGLSLRAGGSVTNSSGGAISGIGTSGSGIFVAGAAGTVANYGSITGASHIGVLISDALLIRGHLRQ